MFNDGVSPQDSGVAPQVDGGTMFNDGVSPQYSGVVPQVDGETMFNDGVSPQDSGVVPQDDGGTMFNCGVRPSFDNAALWILRALRDGRTDWTQPASRFRLPDKTLRCVVTAGVR